MSIPEKISKIKDILSEKYYLNFNKYKYQLKARVKKTVPEEIEALKNEIEKYKVISFDVFDTCLFRVVDNYIDSRKIKSLEYGRIFNKKNKFYRKNWKTAYQNTLKNLDEDKEEATIFEIYNEFIKITGERNVVAEDLVEMEKNIELQLSYRNPMIFEVYKKAKESGKKILFISDMYLPKEVIREMLEKNGYKPENLYVGSEFRKTKAKGTMYDFILKNEGLNPSEIMHIGDNINSDVKKAREKGISAFHFREKSLNVSLFDIERKLYKTADLKINESLTIGLARRNSLLNPSGLENDEKELYNIGYEVIGPTHFFYLLWIIEQAQKNNLKKLFFLSRDGYYLEKHFQKLKKKFNLDIKGEYLFSSRKLYFLPRFYEINEESVKVYTNAQQKLKAKDFLSRLGIDYKEYETEIEKCGFSSSEEIITDDSGNFLGEENRLKAEKLIFSVKEKIEEIAIADRKKFLDYVKEKGVNSKHAGLVDIGWNATSLMHTNDILYSEGLNYPMGFYFGTWSKARECEEKEYNIKSFFMKFDQPRFRRNIIKGSIALLELMFTAPHPTIVGLKKQSENWEPVYEEDKLDEGNKKVIEFLFRGVDQYIADILSMPGVNPKTSSTYIELVLNKLVLNPNYHQARVLGKHKHKISFGSVSQMVPIAPEPQTKLTNANKKKMVVESYWKAGTKRLLKGK